MPRPKGSATKSVKLIYSVLTNEPKCFEDVVNETKLHRNTVASTLNDLVRRGLLRRYRKGHKTMYAIEKTKPPYIGWEIPWIELMTTKKQEDLHYKEAENRARTFLKTYWKAREMDERVRQFLLAAQEKLVSHPANQKLIEVFEKHKMKVTLRILKDNLKKPFCLECSIKEMTPVRSEFKLGAGAFCCPNCGLELQKVPSTKVTRKQITEHFKGLSK